MHNKVEKVLQAYAVLAKIELAYGGYLHDTRTSLAIPRTITWQFTFRVDRNHLPIVDKFERFVVGLDWPSAMSFVRLDQDYNASETTLALSVAIHWSPNDPGIAAFFTRAHELTWNQPRRSEGSYAQRYLQALRDQIRELDYDTGRRFET